MRQQEQKAELAKPLAKSAVKKLKGFDYVEGWHAIAEANRIFGFDGWSRETLDLVQTESRSRSAATGASRIAAAFA